MGTMQAVRIDKREARRRFNGGEMIAVSTTGNHATCSTWHARSDGRADSLFATFADIELLNSVSVRASDRIYWYAPVEEAVQS